MCLVNISCVEDKVGLGHSEKKLETRDEILPVL